MTPDKHGRCWKYGTAGCREHGTNSVRHGAHVYRYCTNPDHDPQPALRATLKETK